MPEIEYKRGEFREFRVAVRPSLHLGTPLEKDVPTGFILEFDGQTVRAGDGGFSAEMPQIRAAVRVGWLVAVDSADPAPAPVRPAGVTVRPAQSQGRERGSAMEVNTVHDEERDLGNIKKVRDRGDGVVRTEPRTASTPPRGEARTAGGRKVLRVDEDDARPVARLRTATKNDVVTVSAETAQRIQQQVNKLDTAPPPKIEPVKVEAARTGDVLDELLPDAISTKIPKPRKAAAAAAEDDEDDGKTPEEREAERLEREARLAEATARAEAARASRLATLGVNADDRPAPTAATKKTAAAKKAAPPPEPEPEQVEEEEVAGASDEGDEPNEAKFALVRGALPDFEWNMARPRQERVDEAIEVYASDPLFLNGILAVEVDEVKKAIREGLSR